MPRLRLLRLQLLLERLERAGPILARRPGGQRYSNEQKTLQFSRRVTPVTVVAKYSKGQHTHGALTRTAQSPHHTPNVCSLPSSHEGLFIRFFFSNAWHKDMARPSIRSSKKRSQTPRYRFGELGPVLPFASPPPHSALPEPLNPAGLC